MSILTAARSTVAQRAPRLEQAVVRSRWRSRNRTRAFSGGELEEPKLRGLLERLRRDGIAVGDFADLFGSRKLFDEAAAEVAQVYERSRQESPGASEGSLKGFLIRLGSGAVDCGDVYGRIVLHPSLLAVAN